MQVRQTKTLESVFKRGRQEAQRLGAKQMSADYLFLAILREENGHAYRILKKLLKEWELYQIKVRVERDLERSIQNNSEPEGHDEHTISKLYINLPNNYDTILNTGHLLQSMVRDNRLICTRVLAQYGVNFQNVSAQLSELPSNEDIYEEMKMFKNIDNSEMSEDDNDLSSYRADPRTAQAPSGNNAGNLSLLEKFGVDMTRAAAEGKIDPVIGRTAEIERVIQILGRRKKNNPVLIGEAGVGKSAIVEGLALRIVNREVPHTLRNKRIYALDIASMIAGTKYRGQFEERIKALLDTLTNNKDIILFIDEIHTIVGAGSTQGSLDTANILKPALARGELQCIGATTLKEYRENIESDGALERRFQKIVVEATTPEQTLQILRNVKKYYEDHHCVNYTDDALKACVTLAERYISDRFFPDKAIDIMDEAGSKAHTFNSKEPEFIKSIENEIGALISQKKEAIRKQEYEKAAEIRNHETALRNRLNDARTEWQKEMSDHRIDIDERMIREVVSAMTGIPSERISQSELSRLKSMGEYLGSVVIGQKEAVTKVTRAIHRSRAGLKDPKRPIGVFMFAGPTGVGKTHLAKELAKYLFDKEDALIRVDMSEYSEKHNVSRLIGSPPGYVGYGEGGQLTEKVRRHPYSVLLFDEIEKAHPDIFNIMLQIFDDGQLTDGLGRTVDFRNTIIIMTSNIGSREVRQYGQGLGYNSSMKENAQNFNRETIFRKSLERNFAPEFINRIDDIVTFNTLTNDDVQKIVELEFKKLHERVVSLGYNIEISTAALKQLVNVGYEPMYGVRSLKRKLLDSVEEPLAEMIVEGTLNNGETIDVGCNDANEIALSVKTK